jgi:ADP-dependent NAD(P)H-hydrate dehydratase / NAD(P)H-hydrate epimerase
MSRMRRVLPATGELPLFDSAQTRSIERVAASRLAPHTLMRRAGESLARLALAIGPHARQVWIAAGPGNNGGDGLEAATLLTQWGKSVEVSLIGSPAARPADAADALARAQAAGVRIHAGLVMPTQPPAVAIDALLGVGANRAPHGDLAETIRSFRGLGCPVLSVDTPSGLDARTGNPLGDACVVAWHTLALLTLKPGLFTAAGRDHVGTVWFDELSIDAPAEPPCAWLSGRVATDALPRRRHAQHKGSFGDVAVVGGAAGMSGAALLAARAAHAAGAGRVYVQMLDTRPSAVSLDMLHPELMFRSDWSKGSPTSIAAATIVCGCGGGDSVRSVLPRLLSLAPRLVLDADALNALASDASLVALLRARAARDASTVLTPHPLEAARLLGCTTGQIQADRLSAAQTLADRFACVVVLKGSGSVTAAPNQTPRITGTGNAALATAGTGDVLAGWLGGRWAQASAPDAALAAFTNAHQAVAEHGAAAEPQPAGALRASDLIERLNRSAT